MLEIFRVVMTNLDEDQHLVVGGVEQVPQGIWRHAPERCAHWPEGTTLKKLHGGAPRPGVKRIVRAADGKIAVENNWGVIEHYKAVLVTCQSWLLTTSIDCAEDLFSQKMWMALDRYVHTVSLSLPYTCFTRSIRDSTEYDQQNTLHAILQDIHHDRPPLLERQRPPDRPRRNVNDPYRPPDPRDIPLRQRPRRARRNLPLVRLDVRCAKDAPSVRRAARATRPVGAGKSLPKRRHREPHRRRAHKRQLGGGPVLPRRVQGRAAGALPVQSSDVRPFHAGRLAGEPEGDVHCW
ncbi:hypothetical protein MRB53_041815 [Persea americana]|nr:hypothetical protein MRB53_041815 [Persea americana]